MESDYKKWGSLWINGLSEDGSWTSFEMTYESHHDTLFVRNTNTLKQYQFPAGRNGSFGGDKFYACLMPNQRLQLLQLKTGKTTTIPGATRYAFLLGGEYLVTFAGGLLTVRNAAGHVTDIIDGVTDYAVHEKSGQLVYGTHAHLGVISFKKYERHEIPDHAESPKHLTWQDDGKAFSYVDTDSIQNRQMLKLYSIVERRLSTFDFSSSGYKIYEQLPIQISNDGKKVFAMVVPKIATAIAVPNVEVWNGNDGELYAEKQRLAGFGDLPKLACWRPAEDTFSLVNSDELFNVMLSNGGDYALLCNRYQYGRLPDYYESVDYYIKDTRSGAVEPFLKQFSHDPNQIGFAALQDKVVYYKDGDWWLYDIGSGSHLNITKGLGVKWDNSDDNAPNQFTVYGNPGWTSDGAAVLLYDGFDLWMISVNGKIRKRLTNGRERGLRYRISQVEFDSDSDNYDGRTAAIIDLKGELLMETLNLKDWSTGYTVLSLTQGMRELVYDAAQYSQINKSGNGYVYCKETFSQSPSIEFKRRGFAKAKKVFESNRQQSGYAFGTATLIYYKDSAGQDLQAALYYPPGFDPAKKYPMVVYIYDTMSNRIHQYQNPSSENREGFNITNYTLNGYLVLLPDFYYHLGDPGISAVSGVTAGVTAILNMNIVERDEIGLIGHSFGGYETNFIVTHSKLFKAAVSGAGVSDIVGQYFHITKNGFAVPDMWRFESQQYRMGKSLYTKKEAYLKNSPVMSADDISTPLLLWCGKDDSSVPMDQSVAYYLALRRLGKACIFLAYPNEGHSLSNPENEKDLTYRVSDWFDHFLKRKPCQWIEKGIE